MQLWERDNGILPADVQWLKEDTEASSLISNPTRTSLDTCSLKCPLGDKYVRAGEDVYLYRSEYPHRVKYICDSSGWYSMIREVQCSGPCTKAGRKKEEGTAFPSCPILPAVLTSRRGVDKNVVRRLRDRTEGHTMAKGWRQIQENHSNYFQRKDL
uniref:DUF6729 domain-containing protein n=1 Tax=Knipowitschia caucasica TaxID=637954 RepID=A0AAV2LX18_KNICA